MTLTAERAFAERGQKATGPPPGEDRPGRPGRPDGSGRPDRPGRRGPRVLDARAWKAAFEVRVALVVGVLAMIPMANAEAPSLPFDDAYISFAYAARLVAGDGFRLTVGSKPVEAFSDPLWVLIMAVGRLAGIGLPTWSRVVNIVVVALLAGLTAGLVRRLNPAAPTWMAAGAAALVAWIPATAYQAVGGLETELFSALLVGALLSMVADAQARRPLSALTVGLCLALGLTRIEGALVFLVMWAVSWTWCRKVTGQGEAVLRFAVPVLLVECARALWFGALVPNSVVAKSGLSSSLASRLVDHEMSNFAAAYWPVLLALAGVLATIVAARRAFPFLLIVLAPVAALAVFEVAVAAGDNYPYERYLLPLLGPLVAVAVVGLSRAGWPSRPNEHLWGLRRPLRMRQYTVGTVAAVLVLTFVTANLHQEPHTTTGQNLNVLRGLSRIPKLFAADHLSAHTGIYQYPLAQLMRSLEQPGDVLAVDEPGILAYYTKLRIVDLFGLADSHIASLPGPPGKRADPNYLFAQGPTFIADHIGGCGLCTGLADDLAYMKDPRVWAYQLVYLVAPSPGRPAQIAVLQRDPSADEVASLDSLLTDGHTQVEGVPPSVAKVIDKTAQRGKDITSPTVSQAAMAVLALRGRFTAIVPGGAGLISVGAVAGSSCRVAATAISLGAAQPQKLTIAVTVNGKLMDTSTLDLGTGAAAEVGTVPLEGSGPFLIHLGPEPGTQAPYAQWAEPRLICSDS